MTTLYYMHETLNHDDGEEITNEYEMPLPELLATIKDAIENTNASSFVFTIVKRK